MSFDEMLKDAIDDASGISIPCPVDGCDGKVRPGTLFESFCALFGYPVVDDTNRPWIADAPGSQTGIIVCNQHNYNGEYIG